MSDKVYLKNPYLTECDAVTSNIIKKNNEVHISFDKTVFYPDLICGQLKDIGTISDIEVLHVYQKDETIYHVLKKPPKKKNVHMKINWSHRWDQMQQHSCQHLLSFAFKNIFNADTVAFRIGSEYSNLDVDLETVTDDMITKIEDYVNKIVLSCFDFNTYVDDFSNQSSSDDLVQKNGNTQTLTTCFGTHVRNTGEIGLIKIRSRERIKTGIRIEFLAGLRTLHDYSKKTKNIENIALLLNAREFDIEKKIDNLLTQKKMLEKSNRDLFESNIRLLAKNLIGTKRKIGSINYIFMFYENEDINDYNRAVKMIIDEHSDFLIMLYSKKSLHLQFLIASSKNLNVDYLSIFSILQKKFPLKYGGSAYFVQGVLNNDNPQEFINELSNMTMKNFNVIL